MGTIPRILLDLALFAALGPVFGKLGGAAVRYGAPLLGKAGEALLANPLTRGAAEAAVKGAGAVGRAGGTEVLTRNGVKHTVGSLAKAATKDTGHLLTHTVAPMVTLTAMDQYMNSEPHVDDVALPMHQQSAFGGIQENSMRRMESDAETKAILQALLGADDVDSVLAQLGQGDEFGGLI